MAKATDYELVEVESYIAEQTGGLHGEVHVRPVAGGRYSTDMRVECPKAMKQNYPVGTRFRIRAKLTDREGGPPFLYTSWQWAYDILSSPEQA